MRAGGFMWGFADCREIGSLLTRAKAGLMMGRASET